MGCGASAPAAATFLANEQPAPKNGYMVDGVPTEGVTMQAWSNFDAGNRYHAQSGLGGALQVASMFIAEAEQGSHFDGSTMEDAVGNAGVGSPETLPITASGAQIGTMSMPPHMSFGIAGVLRDPAGQVIALIATASTQRPSGFSASSA